jgi:hypothetical protein
MRTVAFSLCLFCLLTWLDTSSLAQNATPSSTSTDSSAVVVTKDSQATTIAQQALLRTGSTVAATYADSLSTGTLTIATTSPKSLPVVLKTKGTDRIRIELQMPAGPQIRITNAGQAVIKKPDGNIKRLILNNTISERVRHIPAFSLLAELMSSAVEISGLEYKIVNGQAATVIPLCLPTSSDPNQAKQFCSMTKTKFFVDQETGMVSKMEYTNFTEEDGGSGAKVEIFYSDYRQVSGVAIPFRQDTYINGQLRSLLILDSVTFNSGLADSDFALPEAN